MRRIFFRKSCYLFGLCTLGLLGNQSFASGNMNHSDHAKSKKKVKVEKRKTLSKEAKKSVLAVLSANESLHKSFFKYEAKNVEASAKMLKKAIEAVKDKEIAKLLKFSKTKLSEIVATNNRETNNKNYNLISMALIHIVSKYDVGAKYNAYSCPMVKKKWVQNSSVMAKVHNPYAPNMPHCGQQDSHHGANMTKKPSS